MTADDRCVVALDVGGSSVKSAVVLAGGRVAGQVHHTPIDSSAPADEILAGFTDLIRKTSREIDETGAGFSGIALGFPGPFDYPRGICYIHNQYKYEALYGIDIGAELRRQLGKPGLPVRFRNDAEAAIVGEARCGAGRAYQRLLGVTLGTGIGSAFISNGQAQKGGSGLPPGGAGVPPGGEIYPFLFEGQRGDDVFSSRGLLQRLRVLDGAPIDIPMAAELARRGESRVQEVFHQWGRDLGVFMRPFYLDFDAETLLVLGGIANALDCFGAALASQVPGPVLAGVLGLKAPLLDAADLFVGAAEGLEMGHG